MDPADFNMFYLILDECGGWAFAVFSTRTTLIFSVSFQFSVAVWLKLGIKNI